MPTDSGTEVDRDGERDRDPDRGDRAGSKQKAASTSKTKDLSHVPCKFYKVGGCTAGSSCPFSHISPEPGGQKETCTWFVKGNCKFGHKCALAHILPGQTMAMDRKNKKAAQTAAAAAAAASGIVTGISTAKSASTRNGKRETSSSSSNASNRLPLLAGGATAPTRIVSSGPSGSSSGRLPLSMPLKATISPSAPAPPLQDTDFTSFANLDDMETVDGQKTFEDDQDDRPPSTNDSLAPKQKTISTPSIPVSLPLPAHRPMANTAAKDFGPIGSPPNYRSGQTISPSRINGAPSTSPRGQSHLNGVNINSSVSNDNNTGMLSTSPFSAPGAPSGFPSFSTGGMAASLGSGLTMMGGRKGWGDSTETANSDMGPSSFGGLLSTPSVNKQRFNAFGGRNEYDISIEYDEFSGKRNSNARDGEFAVEDDELEDFLPSSLNDLLTPEERSRRMSRSNSNQVVAAGHLSDVLAAAGATTDSGVNPALTGNATSGLGHRYSRSVPAPTLLGDIKSIWADPSPFPSNAQPTHRGTPSIGYSSRYDPYNNSSHTHGDESGLSMSMGSAGTASSMGMMSPSNASAAFLPGLHHHYMSAKAKQAQAQQAQLGLGGIARQLRGSSNPLFPASNTSTSNNSLANNYLQQMGGLGVPSSTNSSSGFHTHTHGNTQTTYRATPSPFDLTQTLHQQPVPARPIPSNISNQKSAADDALLAPHLLSPSTRALQAHTPGQSLPQGLAAGYSRIHALPPLTNVASPPSSGFVPGTSSGAAPAMSSNEGSFGGEWNLQNPNPPSTTNASSGTGSTGLESMFSRLSYSAATTRGGTPLGPSGSGLSRNVSGGRYPQVQVSGLSPLGGPVVSRDDDDLFDMDK